MTSSTSLPPKDLISKYDHTGDQGFKILNFGEEKFNPQQSHT